MNQIIVSALYRFVALPNFRERQGPLLAFCQSLGIKGTLLLAAEGLNGTVAGSRASIDRLLSHLHADPCFSGLEHKESFYENMPFYRMKVKLKKEIVTMGVEGIDPNHVVGTYVEPKAWNDLISGPEVTLVDTRNTYEYAIGSFKGAINPETGSFRDFSQFVENHLSPSAHKKVAMFCTGGIRCEKSTAYLKQQGFAEVYHLQGGILNYLAEVPEKDSLWYGECFVFDNRVAVNHDLERGSYDQCHGCRHPITEADKQSNQYMLGVACPRCYETLSPERQARFEGRQKQIELARQRGEPHIGMSPTQLRAAKQAKRAKREAHRQHSSQAQ